VVIKVVALKASHKV